jgi:hypothetical protein
LSLLATLRQGGEDGALAMARDALLADVLAERRAPEQLILAHGWSVPTVSAGRVQPLDPRMLREAREAGIDVVRRPTGGGWLLHQPGDVSLTYVAAGPLRAGGLRGAAATIADGIAAGLAAAGRSGEVQRPGRGPGARAAVCFAQVDREEVADEGVKVAGVAVVLRRRTALVQTALPCVPARPAPVAAFAERWDPRRALAVDRLLGLDHERLFSAVIDRIAERSGASAMPLSWEPEWDALAAERAGAHRVEPAGAGRDMPGESR